jgi:hypothetical protein
MRIRAEKAADFSRISRENIFSQPKEWRGAAP